MNTGLPTESSVFDSRKLSDLYDEVRRVYCRYPQPWVIGYSGGKDSTATLQLVWKALEGLPPDQRTKPVYVLSADTGVETPIIVDHINSAVERINTTAQATSMPMQAIKIYPKLTDSFWVNLIGRGYPAPTARFRWCTERLKIRPADTFIADKVAQHGEVVVVLGVRSAESSTRMQLMNSYRVRGHLLRRHSSLSGAYVYAPIAEFSTADVWQYLLQVESPWGSNNRDLASMYRNADAGECPLVIDSSTPPCGNSRFGCWVCTVAETDSSMEGMIDSGYDWLQPLLDFREYLASTADPARKREFRGIYGRDGRAIIKKDGQLAARTYTMETSADMLSRLLTTQQAIRRNGPIANATLITHEELQEIRRIWRTERQDWDDSVPKIVASVCSEAHEWPIDDDFLFDGDTKRLLSAVCLDQNIPFELAARILEEERRSQGMARRASIHKSLLAVLSREWRDEQTILSDAAKTLDNDRC